MSSTDRLIAIIVVCVTLFYIVSHIVDSKDNTEISKSGLQQCLESGRVLWKKECK